jgi:hypothetical protein
MDMITTNDYNFFAGDPHYILLYKKAKDLKIEIKGDKRISNDLNRRLNLVNNPFLKSEMYVFGFPIKK